MLKTRQKISLAIILMTLVASVSTAGFIFFYTQRSMRSNTNEYLTEQAISQAHELNGVIIGLETAVNGIEKTVSAMIDENRISDNDYYLDFSKELERVAEEYDVNDINAMSVYVRFDPKLSYATAGFFHADTNNDGILERLEPTDLSVFSPSDREHVGWFYEPIEAGHAIWMEPYYNANIGIEMVSYVHPIIVNGRAIGVAGADINFDQLRSIAEKQIQAGRIFILNQNYQFLVHDQYSMDDKLDTVDGGKLGFVRNMMEAQKSGVVHYALQGEKKVLGFSKLSNEWTVIVALTEAEAFTKLNRTTLTMTVITIGITAFMLIGALILSRHISGMTLRNSELTRMVDERTTELRDTNHYLEQSLAEIQNREAELTVLNDQLESTLVQVNEMQDQLIRSEKLAALGSIVSGLSHEINTPLGIIITTNSYLQGLLSKPPIGPEQIDGIEEGTEIIQSATKKLSNLVESFRMLAFESTNLDVRKFSLDKLIRDLEFEMNEELTGQGHVIKVDAPDDLNIVSYPYTIEFILRQLISNSVIHGFESKASGVIVISASASEDDVVIRYSDNGCGIRERDMGRIFDPFFSSKKHLGHIGLGLHITYNLVSQVLKGEVRVVSKPEDGIEAEIVFKQLKP